MKQCKKCGENKPVNQFYFRKDTNRPRNECKTCCNTKNIIWVKGNLDKRKQHSTTYYRNNTEKVKNSNERWRKANPEKVTQQSATY
jgi:hypothetical protein